MNSKHLLVNCSFFIIIFIIFIFIIISVLKGIFEVVFFLLARLFLCFGGPSNSKIVKDIHKEIILLGNY